MFRIAIVFVALAAILFTDDAFGRKRRNWDDDDERPARHHHRTIKDTAGNQRISSPAKIAEPEAAPIDPAAPIVPIAVHSITVKVEHWPVDRWVEIPKANPALIAAANPEPAAANPEPAAANPEPTDTKQPAWSMPNAVYPAFIGGVLIILGALTAWRSIVVHRRHRLSELTVVNVTEVPQFLPRSPAPVGDSQIYSAQVDEFDSRRQRRVSDAPKHVAQVDDPYA